MDPVLTISIPSAPEQHDDLLRNHLAPLIRRLDQAAAASAVWFDRVNKPEWGIRVLASGAREWLEDEARAAMAEVIGAGFDAPRFVELELDEKWTGGLRHAGKLAGFHRHDTRACLAAIEADASGELGSRAQFSMRVVEGLLDAHELHDDRRLHFYRESFDWAFERGRWDQEVLTSLEQAFANQRHVLAAMIERGDDGLGRGPWPSAAAARIGRELIARIGDWAMSTPGAAGEIALHAAHSHSNRLGIHGGREAALRYLIFRARGGRALAPA